MRRRALLIVSLLCAAPAVPRADAPEARAREDYMLNCQGCHLPDGAGVPGRVPPLSDSVGRFLRVPGGRGYLLRVPGVAGSSLGDADVAAVMNWIMRHFAGATLPPDFRPFTPAEVAAARAVPLRDVPVARARLLRLMPGPSGGTAQN